MNQLSAESIASLEARLGVTFVDKAMLLRSLSHRSWCSEHGDVESNERLEFLGDSVLGVVVTRFVFDEFPDLPEGMLSEVRAAVVNSRSLAELAGDLGLGDFMLLGRGEAAGGGSSKPSILADAFEAVIAAIYLDAGFDVARSFVLSHLTEGILAAAHGDGARDHKTRLQELSASRGLGRPRYVVSDEGPDHAKHFYASVLLEEAVQGTGEGRSKKEAEQAAAWVAVHSLTNDLNEDQNGRVARN